MDKEQHHARESISLGIGTTYQLQYPKEKE
jgi:hypothetical protein